MNHEGYVCTREGSFTRSERSGRIRYWVDRLFCDTRNLSARPRCHALWPHLWHPLTKTTQRQRQYNDKDNTNTRKVQR